MILEHDGKQPTITSNLRIAPSAVIAGECGPIRLAANVIVMDDVMPRYARAVARWHALDIELE